MAIAVSNIARAFLERRPMIYSEEISMGAYELSHYGRVIAGWSYKSETLLIPWVSTMHPTPQRVNIINEIVMQAEIPDMRFVLHETAPQGKKRFPHRTIFLNGVDVSDQTSIELCGELGALALAAKFGHSTTTVVGEYNNV